MPSLQVCHHSKETKGSSDQSDMPGNRARFQEEQTGFLAKMDILLCGPESKTFIPAWLFASMHAQRRLWQNVTTSGGECCDWPWSLCVKLPSRSSQQVPGPRPEKPWYLCGHLHSWCLSGLQCVTPHTFPLCSSWIGRHSSLCRNALDKYWPENLS